MKPRIHLITLATGTIALFRLGGGMLERWRLERP